MSQFLLVTVRFHDGRYHGESDGFNNADGWPPAPSRLFQALVAGAAQGGLLHEEDMLALQWLERLDPPTIAAPQVQRGKAVRMFVPNNDLDSQGGDPAKVGEIRVGKYWRPCYFDSNEPLLYVWDFSSGESMAARICHIATKLYQLGRGIDMAWATGEILNQTELHSVMNRYPITTRIPNATAAGDVGIPKEGTLESLIDRYNRNRTRLNIGRHGGKTIQIFEHPPKSSFSYIGYDSPPRYLYFELRDKDASNFKPYPLTKSAPLTSHLLNQACQNLQKFLPDKFQLYERLIIGRNADSNDLFQRIRLIPLPSIGTRHTDPSIRRVVIEVPAECPIPVDDIRWAFTTLSSADEDGLSSAQLISTEDSQMANQYMRKAKAFHSVTAIALSHARRGTKNSNNIRSKGEELAVKAIVQSLRHARIQARPSYIHVQREPFEPRGSRAEYFSNDSRFSRSSLWHAEIRFDDEVPGPLLIGDGRFCGLGLMRPIDHPNGSTSSGD